MNWVRKFVLFLFLSVASGCYGMNVFGVVSESIKLGMVAIEGFFVSKSNCKKHFIERDVARRANELAKFDAENPICTPLLLCNPCNSCCNDVNDWCSDHCLNNVQNKSGICTSINSFYIQLGIDLTVLLYEAISGQMPIWLEATSLGVNSTLFLWWMCGCRCGNICG